jgi:LAO/AO transport system kinase
MLSLAAHDGHVPSIVKTVASEDRGVVELLAAVEAFRAKAEASGLLMQKRRAHLRQQFEARLRERLLRHAWSRLSPQELEATLDRLARRETDPFRAADVLLGKMGLS